MIGSDPMPLDVPVIVVGAGPVGATLALLLARHGIESLVVDRKAGPQEHPAAHVLSTRTLEIWRELGLARAVRSESARLHELRYIVYCTTLAGVELGRVPIGESTARELDAIEAYSPTRAAHLPQNRLERILWDAMAREQRARLAPSTAYVSHETIGDRVRVTLRDETDGRLRSVVTRYVVAADGAGSSVRRALGVAMEGPVLQYLLSVHFASPSGPRSVERYLASRRGPVVWVHHPSCGFGAFIVHRPPDDYVFQIPWFPPFQSAEDFDEASCERRVRAAIGGPADVRIRSIRPWVMTAQLADGYRVGRVLLAGDAAHRFPPTGGLGLNTGVHDAHNLAWKLAWVLQGRADETLLETYERERRPIAEANCRHSMTNVEKTFDVHAAMGVPAAGRRMLADAATSAVARAMPKALGRWALERGMAASLSSLAVLEERSKRGSQRRRAVREAIAGQREHYRFWGQDLGYCYAAGAVVPDGSRTDVVDVEHLVATTRPGGRLPHAWVRVAGNRVSTLDVPSSSSLTLLIGPGDPGGWAGVARPGVAPVVLDDHPASREGWGAALAMPAEGALLVRPDGHVAALLRSSRVESLLDDALARVVPKPNEGRDVAAA